MVVVRCGLRRAGFRHVRYVCCCLVAVLVRVVNSGEGLVVPEAWRVGAADAQSVAGRENGQGPLGLLLG